MMKIKEKPIVVFGGTGHYGRHIVQKLLKKNETVRVLSRNSQRAKEILGKNVKIIEGDITSREAVVKSLENVKAIIICVSTVSRKLIKRMRQIERDAILMILQEAKKANISRLVYISGYDIRKDVLEVFAPN